MEIILHESFRAMLRPPSVHRFLVPRDTKIWLQDWLLSYSDDAQTRRTLGFKKFHVEHLLARFGKKQKTSLRVLREIVIVLRLKMGRMF